MVYAFTRVASKLTWVLQPVHTKVQLGWTGKAGSVQLLQALLTSANNSSQVTSQEHLVHRHTWLTLAHATWYCTLPRCL